MLPIEYQVPCSPHLSIHGILTLNSMNQTQGVVPMLMDNQNHSRRGWESFEFLLKMITKQHKCIKWNITWEGTNIEIKSYRKEEVNFVWEHEKKGR